MLSLIYTLLVDHKLFKYFNRSMHMCQMFWFDTLDSHWTAPSVLHYITISKFCISMWQFASCAKMQRVLIHWLDAIIDYLKLVQGSWFGYRVGRSSRVMDYARIMPIPTELREGSTTSKGYVTIYVWCTICEVDLFLWQT